MAEHAVVEWKPILGFASYHVSNQGEVMNIRTKRILKPGILPNGYFFVILRKEKRSYNHYVHRLVALAFLDNPEMKPCVDHISRLKSDNAVANLRWCTHSENAMNRKKKPNTTSSYIGVCWCKRCQKWIAYISVDKRVRNLGYFTDELDVASAYNDAAVQFHKEFASLNPLDL